MGRFWFGTALLAVLLLTGWLLGSGISSAGEASVAPLEQAAAAALEGDWAAASENRTSAQAHWEKVRPFAAALCRHEPVEQIDLLFAQLEAFEADRDTPEYAATAVGIAQTLKTLPVPHRFHWWNLL